MCFMVASFNYPEVGKLVWGKTADELDYATCAALSGSGSGIDDAGLGTLVRMTRLHDLGLDQSPEGFGR
ncbi:hypothetical protein BD410DRAFT_783090 [Rickenella mellea]|uniref:Uncharacterized protein n=1 Tax=Rickenella mellea TaxID=50990 RepID=A0A4Y7QHZ1_9AGAM|nr:hypothetical protein BD410DRAFT_783090 [Rickenella mellea]